MSYNLQIANELIHFHKTGEASFSKILIDHHKRCKLMCPFQHGKKTDLSCYLTNPALSDFFILLNKYIRRLEYFPINIYSLKTLTEYIQIIQKPEKNSSIKEFKSNLVKIISVVKMHEKELFKLIRSFTCEECKRLDEAINAFESDCYYASVIMSVSAVESRLHYLIKNKNLAIYNRLFKNATLGQIIKFLDPNEYTDKKFKSIKKQLPTMHKPLIEVLNIYRVFSAHPLNRHIDFKTAQSVLNLSFNFLLSEESKIKDPKLLQHT